MRRSPLAILALATVALFPSTLSAHSHHTKSIPSARLVATRPSRSAHLQHPQPAFFRPSRELPGTHKEHRTDKTPHKRAAQYAAPKRTIHHATRNDLASVPASKVRGRLILQPAHRLSHPEPNSIVKLDHPREPTPVVAVIRPTTDKPQLPNIQQAATEPIILPALYNERGRLVVPAPLVGSHEILVRQNELADQDGLGRVQDDVDLDGMRAKRMLVALPAGESLHVDDRLPYNRRFCRPWTAQFLSTLARAHYARFGTPLQVNSAVRTVEFQLRLQRTNGNAAPAEGDTASPHLTGQAVDIAKRGLSLPEIAWLRGYLLPLIQAGRVDVEEEFQQSCFHISVYRRYLPQDAEPQRYIANRSPSTLAVAIR